MILLNVLYKQANGERLTAEEMQRLIERADADKLQKAGCPTHSRVSNEWASGITRLRVFHHRPHIYPTTNLRV